MMPINSATIPLLALFVFIIGGSVVGQESKPLSILFLGDSLTEGYGIAKSEAFPARVGELLRERDGREVKILNAGVSGSTTASGLERLNWYLKSGPDIVVIALGANDGLRGVPVDASKSNLTKIVERAKANDVQVVLAGMMVPPNYGPDYTQQFEAMYRQIAKEQNVPLIPFLLEGVAGKEEYNLADGIHPNPAGHRIMAETVFKHLGALL